jgi:nicotinate-nucleotide--dimethylbenzimidazole phosphoribosyltransferase
MTPSASPFDDIRDLVRKMPGPDEAAKAVVRMREATLIKPPGALGRLEAISEHCAAWQGKARPTADRAMVALFGADHGVAARGVSPYPQSVTGQMLMAFSAGGAAINQLCLAFGLGLKVFDLGIGTPSGDISREAAMDEKDCAAAIAFGMEAIAGGADVLALGEMGIGNTTVAAAIYAALYGGGGASWVGRGAASDVAMVAHKAAVVDEALATHAGHLDDPLEVLRRLGGREIAGLVGAIIAARHQRIPVILDGFVVGAAAAILHALDPKAIAHCLAGHVSAERTHPAALLRMGLSPMLDLGMRLGEGSGAALAIAVVRGALACHNGMATFGEAAVDGRV